MDTRNIIQKSSSIKGYLFRSILKTLVAQTVKRLSAMQETRVWSLGWKDSLEKEMAAHSSILAWKIPWTAEPGRLPSMGSRRVGHDWVTSLHFKDSEQIHLNQVTWVGAFTILKISTEVSQTQFNTSQTAYFTHLCIHRTGNNAGNRTGNWWMLDKWRNLGSGPQEGIFQFIALLPSPINWEENY